ncbi:outer membrane beta-barrel protein [Pelagibius sp. 7325]|uniref:outer membrane beta-barrel protein n=1 Tax=Pelagibius sp. 7325 TaxID=3131994 RepID=UPI0030EC766C
MRRLLAGTALTSIMLGLVLPAGAARAQEGDQPVAVFDRSRPAFDPKGIDLGGFRLYPRAGVSETYDDNIFADESNEQDDFITAVDAALLAESEWSRHEVKVDARVRHEAFIDNSDQDRTEYFLRPALRLDLGERDTARFNAEQSRRVVGRDDPEDAGDEEPTEFNRFLAGGEYIHRVNRVFFGFNAEARRDDYISGGDDDRDRNEYRFGLPVGYEVSAITDVTLEPFVRLRDFDELDSTGADRDAQAAGATVGLDTELTRLVHLNFDVGFVANDYEDSRFDDSVDLIFGGEAIWYATEMTTLKARAERRDIATSQPGSSSKTQSSAGVEVQHELMRNVLLGGEVRYINDDFREVDRVDNRAQLDLSAEYLLNRYVSVAAEYRYEQRWSDADNQDYSRNLITVGLKTRF